MQIHPCASGINFGNIIGMNISTDQQHEYHAEIHQQNGSHPYLILLHGFMGSGDAFSHLIPSLQRFCNPVTIDLLGHGASGHAEHQSEFKVENQIADLDDIIRHMPFSKCFLYGYSMGGRLALQYACSHSSHLRGLVLESATYGIESSTKRKQRTITDHKRARAIENNFGYFLQKWSEMPLFNAGGRVPADRKQRYEDLQRSQSPRQMALSLRGFGSGVMPSCRNKLPNLQIPVLLLAGRYDEKYCDIMDEMHHLLPDAELHIVPDAGHRIHLEQSEMVAELLNSFIQQN